MLITAIRSMSIRWWRWAYCITWRKGGCAALDVLARGEPVVLAAVGVKVLRGGEQAREHGLPFAGGRQRDQRALGGEVGVRAAQVEVEGRRDVHYP